MARIILFCNGVRINSIADLYNNFNFEDLKISLTSGKLQYWLTTNGFSVECEAVEKIDCNAFDADIQIMRALKYPDEKQNAYLEAKRLQAEKAEAEKKALEEAKRLQAEKAEADIVNVSSQKTDEQDGCIFNTTCWQLCQLEKNPVQGKIIASTQMIAEENLASSKLISGEAQRYNLSEAFFFNGYFWAQVFKGEYCDTWAKSADGINWELDAELNKLLKDSNFCVERIKVCDKHIFMLTSTTYAQSLIIYSSQDGWFKKELNMDRIMSSPKDESDLEDVYEQNDYVGIAGVRRWKTSLFVKENHWYHGIFSCSDLSGCSDSDFSRLHRYSNYACGDVITNAFKDCLFVASGNKGAEFLYGELDQGNPDFKNVELPEEIKINFYDKFFVFDNAMFVISTASEWFSRKNASGKLLFTADGLEWKECEIGSDRIVSVGFTGRKYVALSEEDHGKSTLYSSETGEIWNKVQTFTFSRGEKVDVLTAGNDKILIYNDSSSGKYILVNAIMI